MNDPLKPIFKSSPQAGITTIRKGIPKYPWVEVQPGFSFIINPTDMQLNTARSFASRMQKKFGKKFRVIDHGAEVGYEVACLPMTEDEAIQTSSNVIEANDKIEDSMKIDDTKKALEEHIAKMAAMGVHMPKIGND